jgi:cell wall-associated NlpC family hydrolase
MKLNYKKKREITSVLAFALVLTAASASFDSGRTDAVAYNYNEEGVTAGVSDVWNTDTSCNRVVTAGVGDIIEDVNTLVVEDTDLAVVAEGQEDDSICGFSNIGIASVDGNLNVRSGPSTDDSIVGKMTNHAACEIISTDGEWTQIESGEVSGYINNEYLITGEEAKQIAREEVRTVATVQTQTLRVRDEASTDSDILSLVGEGEDLTVTEELDGWYKVEVDNEEGYVSSEYVTLSQKLPTAMTLTQLRYGEGVSDVRVALVDFALQYVGNKYVWGGTSLTKGVDCSGFTMKVYEQFGISLPHSSSAQAGYGTSISASEAKPGDLFFYGRSGVSGIGHVAIYIGNGQIVHASNARDGIKISNAYYRTPIKVVRLLSD